MHVAVGGRPHRRQQTRSGWRNWPTASTRSLAASSVVVTRTRKGEELTDDIRAGIYTLELLGPVGPDPSHGAWLEAELACRPRGLRPSEVLAALDPGLEERQVRRTHQWILRDGARREPLVAAEPPGATAAPHALERAS